jgi:hypothetical protein
LGVQLLVIQEQVDGLGNFHAPPPLFDGIMLMLIYREYHKFLRKSDKFLTWQSLGRVKIAFRGKSKTPLLKEALPRLKLKFLDKR